jgi:hypothetical protein
LKALANPNPIEGSLQPCVATDYLKVLSELSGKPRTADKAGDGALVRKGEPHQPPAQSGVAI